ncbi:MAG: putative porin, partial [Planctomycetota bacterium]|nr:putative porin [Planctomycetota bacterium]
LITALSLVAPLAGLSGPSDTLADRLDFYGDMRVRAEGNFADGNGPDRHRGRLRFRLGAKLGVSEHLSAEVRVISTSGDANNPHWDMGSGDDGFNGSDMAFDRLNLSWSCEDVYTAKVGRFGHGFASNPVYGELLWDGDVQPAGLSYKYSPKGLGLDLRLAGYVVDEFKNGADANMTGAQANWNGDLAGVGLQLSSALYSWSSMNGAAGWDDSSPQGSDMGARFRIWDSILAATVAEGENGKAVISGQYIQNTNGDEGEDTAWAVGAKYGTSKKTGAWNVFATLYDMEANAVFGPVAQDDTPVSGTGNGDGMEGVIAGVNYWPSDDLNLRVWALTSEFDDATQDRSRLRIDLNLGF